MATHQQQESIDGHQRHDSIDTSPATTRDPPGHANQLWVELEIDRMGNTACPIAEFGDQSVNGRIQLAGEQCHASLSVEDQPGSAARLFSTSIEKTCTCNLVCEPGISPAELLVEDGSLEITAIVESRDRLVELSDRLRERGEDWRLRRLTTAGKRTRSESAQADQLQDQISLTAKQREVVEEAVSKGYYANPREASLSDLAEELEVTRSALSQRLNAVEAKLIDVLATEL